MKPVLPPLATCEVDPAVSIVGQPVTVTEIGVFWQTVSEPPIPPTIGFGVEAGLTVKPAFAGIGFTVNVYVVGKLGQP